MHRPQSRTIEGRIELTLHATTKKDGAVRFEVRVKSNARVSAIRGVHDGALRVDVAAPPRDGAANEELIRVVAKTLGVPKSHVSVALGASARSKVLEVAGVEASNVVERLRVV